jgi:hypothetical protein
MKETMEMVKMQVTALSNRIVREERGEVNVVAIVVLIGVAVILALIFRDAIVSLLETLFASITSNAQNAVTK